MMTNRKFLDIKSLKSFRKKLTVKEIDIIGMAVQPQLKTKDIIDLDAIKNFAIGIAVVSGLVWYVAGAAALVIPAAAPPVLGAGLLFSLYAGGKGFIDVRKKKHEMALNEIKKAIIASAINFKKNIIRDLDYIARDLRKECHNLFENMLQSTIKELETRLLDIQKSRSRTKQESQREIKSIKVQFESLIELDKRIHKIAIVNKKYEVNNNDNYF